jgi:MarR family transcriptional regulator, organic hydroperoxide resistance regulator
MNPLSLDNQLCFPLYAVARATQRAYRPLLLKLGLSYPQYLTMMVLWEQDPQPIRDIGRRLRLDSGTLTPLLKRLERRGVIRRVRSREDERVVEIHLTEEGLSLREEAVDIPMALLGKIDMEPQALRDLRATLYELLGRLEDASRNDPSAHTSGS